MKTIFTVFVCIWTTMLCTAGASEFDKLTEKIPRGANAIMLIDVDAALASPIAKANSWQSRIQVGGADRPLYLPPEADKVVVAAQLDEVRGFTRTWEVAMMGLKEPMPISLVARAEGGYADTVNGVKVAWVPSDAYFIDIDPNTLGLMAPADRQTISRWADRAKMGKSTELTEYLRVAAIEAGKGPQFVMAIDTTNAIQPHRLRARLEESEYVKSKKLNTDELLTLIGGLQGVVLKITLTDKIQASARIDFSTSVKLSSEAAKGLILESLTVLQMELPDTEDWTCSIGGSSMLFEGEFSNDGLRRVLSLMEIPTTKFSSLKDQNVEAPSQDDAAKNSLAYFQSTEVLLKDLRSKSKSASGDAYWIDRYASKIDNLPILHVDDDLLDYGQKLSGTLRVMSGARKMTNLQGGAASRANLAQATFDNGYGYGNFNYSTPKSRETSAGNARANAAATGTATKLEGWNLIDNAAVEIRREMTKRYSVEF